jgi:low affinity Fe/Cu permease
MDDQPQAILMPLDVSSRVGFFDRVAGTVARVTSRAPFFAFCVLLVGLWLLQGIVQIVGSGWSSFTSSTYQLEINTTTTIITFLLVALVQNSQTRNDNATQHKLNAIADGLADMMAHLADQHDDEELRHDIRELRAAVGLEEHESSSENRSKTSAPARS